MNGNEITRREVLKGMAAGAAVELGAAQHILPLDKITEKIFCLAAAK